MRVPFRTGRPHVQLVDSLQLAAGRPFFRFAPSTIIGARVAPSSGISRMEPPPQRLASLVVVDTLLLAAGSFIGAATCLILPLLSGKPRPVGEELPLSRWRRKMASYELDNAPHRIYPIDMRYRLSLLCVCLFLFSTFTPVLHHHDDGCQHDDCPICVAGLHYSPADVAAPAPVIHPVLDRIVFFTPMVTAIIAGTFPSAVGSRAPPP